ncbi:hypothetical protein Emag_001083 [Eimeria magna]
MRAYDSHANGTAPPFAQVSPQQQLQQEPQPSAAAAAAAGAAAAGPQFTGGFQPTTPEGLASRANLAAGAASGSNASRRPPIYSGGSQQSFYSPSSPVASPPDVTSGIQSPSLLLPAQPVRTDISVLFSPKPTAASSSRVSQPLPRQPSRSPTENYQRLHGNVTYAANPVVFKEPPSQMNREVGRSVSNYLGIGGEDRSPSPTTNNSSNSNNSSSSYTPPLIQNTTPAGPSSTSSVEQSAAESAEETETTEGVAPSLMERRTVNPYDLSHIFPDIYSNPEPPLTESLMHQSLPLLEMTVVAARD